MEIASVISIVGGVLTVITIIVKKNVNVMYIGILMVNTISLLVY